MLRTLEPAVDGVSLDEPGISNGCVRMSGDGLIARFHYFGYTTLCTLPEVVSEIGRVFLHEPIADDAHALFHLHRGAHGYEFCLTGPNGINIYHDPDRFEIYVQVPGAACEAVHTTQAAEIFGGIPKKMTRVDVALDGLKRLDGSALDPLEVYQLAKTSHQNLRTRANIAPQDHKPPEERSDSLCYTENPMGRTCRIGNRSSARMARIYNAHGFTRFEVEIKDKKAVQLKDVFEDCTDGRSVVRKIIGIIRGFCDFIEPDVVADRSRAPLTDWWAAIVEHCESINPALQMPEKSMKKIIAWLDRQVSTALYMLVTWAGGDLELLMNLLELGKSKMGSRHRRILAMAGGEGAWQPPAPF